MKVCDPSTLYSGSVPIRMKDQNGKKREIKRYKRNEKEFESLANYSKL